MMSESRSDKIFVDFDLSPNYAPLLTFRELVTGSLSSISLSYGDNIAWLMRDARYCVGYHVKDEYHYYEACPTKSLVEKGVQCTKCRQRDMLFPCMICDGSECINTKKVWEECAVTPTSIYIAIFGGMMKVGVSRKDRLLKRWIEQGADHASEVAIAPNGLVGREIESAVSKEFEVTKSVRIQKKVKSMSKNGRLFDDIQTEEEVITEQYLSRLRGIAEWISAKYGKGLAVSDPTITDLHQFYGPELKGSPIRLSVLPNKLEGSFLGMKGPLFCLMSHKQTYVLDIRNVRGRLCNLEVSAGDLSASSPPEAQSSISDYFH